MPVYSLAQLTKAEVVTAAVTRQRVRNTKFQEMFGVMTSNPELPGTVLSGPNVVQRPGRDFSWDLYDHSRQPASVRAPGQPPGTQAKRVIGHAKGRAIRVHTAVPILAEEIFRTRPMGGQWGATGVDTNGQSHILLNERNLAQEDRSLREFAISRMCRGQFYIHRLGDDMFVSDSSSGDADTIILVDYQIPAGNKTKLNMTDVGGTSIYSGDILATSWDNVAAPIPGDLDQIKAAMEIQHSRPLRDIWLNQASWQNVRKNTDIKALAGTSNAPVAIYDPASGALAQPGSLPDAGYIAVLTGLPMYRWHVYDAVLEVFNGTTGSFPSSPFIPDDRAIFMPAVDQDWFQFVEGSEMIQETLTSPQREVFGFNAWSRPTIEPTGIRLTDVDNFLPFLYNPFCICYGTIIY